MNQTTDHPKGRLRAAVIGLGQVGSRFDEEPGRKTVWSHAGAYLHLADRFELCGTVELSSSQIGAFRKRCPTVPVYGAITDLIALQRPQVASICTPPQTHCDILFKLLESPELRLIWCEKPLSNDFDEARRMVDACRTRGVQLMVSFNRHWLPLWLQTRAMINDGVVGVARSLRIAMPNRVLTIGSHAADLALFLGGPIETVAAISLPSLEESDEPAISALLRYRSGAAGIIQVTGFRAQLIVEAEVIGDDGRLWAREDSGRIAIERFAPSSQYTGYRTLGVAREENVSTPTDFSPFVAMAENVAGAVTDGMPLECDGGHALEVQRVLDLMLATAR